MPGGLKAPLDRHAATRVAAQDEALSLEAIRKSLPRLHIGTTTAFGANKCPQERFPTQMLAIKTGANYPTSLPCLVAFSWHGAQN